MLSVKNSTLHEVTESSFDGDKTEKSSNGFVKKMVIKNLSGTSSYNDQQNVT